MKLNFKPREHKKKSDAATLRREGFIPAVIYHKDKSGAGEVISICKNEFATHMRHVPQGRLSTTLFTLEDGKGKGRSVLIKDIQYFPIDYSVMHIDFEALDDKTPVKVNVPILLQGEADSVGVKLGGMPRVVIRNLKVECLPKDIPSFFVVDIKNMNIGEVLRLSQLDIPKTVRPLMKLDVVAVTMVKK